MPCFGNLNPFDELMGTTEDNDVHTWNYRIVQYESGEVGLHEVYYTNGVPHSRTERPTAVGENQGEIINTLYRMYMEAQKYAPIPDSLFPEKKK